MVELVTQEDRSRFGWWLVAVVIALIVALVLHTFVGTFVLGLFFYYGLRPVNRRLERLLGSRGWAAAATYGLVALPALVLLGYLGLILLHDLTTGQTLRTVQGVLEPYVSVPMPSGDAQQVLGRLVQNPRSLVGQEGLNTLQQVASTAAGVLGFLLTGLFHLTLALILGFYLLRDDTRLAGWFRSEFGEESTAYGYASAVDQDLEIVYSGNIIAIGLIAVLAILTYNGYNLIAPGSVAIPMPTIMGVLTGVASLIPIVVGKVVYLPVTAYLGLVSVATDPGLLVYPVGLLVVAFLFLDLLPQTFLIPRVAGRTLHVGLVMLSYIFGTMLFGWYGLFYGPLLLVVVVHFVRIVFSQLVHGGEIRPDVRSASGLGADPDADPEESGQAG